MERKTRIQSIISAAGAAAGKAASPKGLGVLLLGLALGAGSVVGAFAIYFLGYQQGLMVATELQEQGMTPSRLLVLPPPFAEELTQRDSQRDGSVGL